MRWISAGLADVLCVSYTDTQEICSNLTATKEFTGQRLFLPRGVGSFITGENKSAHSQLQGLKAVLNTLKDT